MRKKCLIWIVLTFIAILCVGCSLETEEITYSNLVDYGTQVEIGELLADNGINIEEIDLLIKQVKDYNKLMEDTHTFKEGFITIEGRQVNYDISYPMEVWNSSGRKYSDFNSRIIAYELFKDYIQCGVPKEVIQDIALLFDFNTMDTNPLANIEKKDREKFISLYEAMSVKDIPIDRYDETIQEIWNERGLVFQEKLDISMINAFVSNQETKELFVAHAGILIETKGHLLYLEKYGTLYPYQATRFKTRKEVKAYLMDKLKREYDEENNPFIIMENNEVAQNVDFFGKLNHTIYI